MFIPECMPGRSFVPVVAIRCKDCECGVSVVGYSNIKIFSVQ